MDSHKTVKQAQETLGRVETIYVVQFVAIGYLECMHACRDYGLRCDSNLYQKVYIQ